MRRRRRSKIEEAGDRASEITDEFLADLRQAGRRLSAEAEGTADSARRRGRRARRRARRSLAKAERQAEKAFAEAEKKAKRYRRRARRRVERANRKLGVD